MTFQFHTLSETSQAGKLTEEKSCLFKETADMTISVLAVC